MNRKYLPLLVGGLLVLAVVAGLVYVLLSARGRYQEGMSSLAMVQGKLARLTSRPVFPSAANVQTLGKQADVYQDYLGGLFDDMRQGQGAVQAITRDGFRQTIEEKYRELVREARDKNVVLPADFAFGFQRYTAGNLPAEDEMDRLVDQLRSVAALCRILYDSGVAELTAVERTVFEKDAQAAPEEEEYGRRGMRNRADAAEAPPPSIELYRDPDGLFTREHYALSFRAAVPAVWSVLNRFAKGTPFAVVTKVEIANEARPAVAAPKTEEAATAGGARPVAATAAGWQSPGLRADESAKKEPEILPRELRVVAGQELPAVRLELDLYRFAEAAAAQGEENP